MKPEFIEAENGWWEDAPTLFRHWRKGIVPIHEAGDWCYPELTPAHEEMSDWVHVGWSPKPRGPRQAFLHHYRHGRLMGYPFLSVLVFALKHGEIGRDV